LTHHEEKVASGVLWLKPNIFDKNMLFLHHCLFATAQIVKFIICH